MRQRRKGRKIEERKEKIKELNQEDGKRTKTIARIKKYAECLTVRWEAEA